MKDTSEGVKRRGQEQELSEEEIRKRRNAARAGMKRKHKKSSLGDYGYHIVIGGFILICLWAVWSVVATKKIQLDQVEVIDMELIENHNVQDIGYSLGPNEHFQGWSLKDAKYTISTALTQSRYVTPCQRPDSGNIILKESYNFYDEFPTCVGETYSQGNCSASYSIASVTALSDRFCKSDPDNTRIELSPHSVLSCIDKVKKGREPGK